jgi:hypothetical protein
LSSQGDHFPGEGAHIDGADDGGLFAGRVVDATTGVGHSNEHRPHRALDLVPPNGHKRKTFQCADQPPPAETSSAD